MTTPTDEIIVATSTPDHEPHTAKCASCSFTGTARREWTVSGGSWDGQHIALCAACKAYASNNGVRFVVTG